MLSSYTSSGEMGNNHYSMASATAGSQLAAVLGSVQVRVFGVRVDVQILEEGAIGEKL